MDHEARKAAIADYKDRKAGFGVFAVISEATGEVWVGTIRHLETQKNGIWFSLRQGASLHRTLQVAWTLHGEGAFRFEELERLRDDYPPLSRPNELKRRQALWLERLQAKPI
jgi:hypothetical protein